MPGRKSKKCKILIYAGRRFLHFDKAKTWAGALKRARAEAKKLRRGVVVMRECGRKVTQTVRCEKDGVCNNTRKPYRPPSSTYARNHKYLASRASGD